MNNQQESYINKSNNFTKLEHKENTISPKGDLIFHELMERIRLLEKGNVALKGRMVERLLLWLGSETINNSDSNSKIVYHFLERTVRLLNLHSAFCYELNNSDPVLIDACFGIQSPKSFKFLPSELLLDELQLESKFLTKGDLLEQNHGFSFEMLQEVGTIAFIPFQSLSLPFGVFVFVDYHNKDTALNHYKLVLEQLVSRLIDKLEKESLMKELKSLNHSFEEQLEKRTVKFRNNIDKLKQEIKERKVIKQTKKVSEKPEAKRVNGDSVLSDVNLLKDMGVEIRTPMNGIKGFAEILRDDNIPAQEKENYIDIIKSCANSILQIVDDSVKYARLIKDNPAPNKSPFELTPFFTKLYDHFKSDELYRQRENVELRLNLNIQAGKSIASDVDMLEQLLSNFISNAIKFTVEGNIEFGGYIEGADNERGGERLILYVKDTGIGILPEIQEHIFEPFYKLEHESSSIYGGMGLGLSIAKELAKLLGGEIWFDSVPQQGSSFYFGLPVDQEKEAKGNSNLKLDYDKVYDWNDKKILIVEDDPMSVLYLKEVFRPTGAAILHAGSGHDGVEVFRNEPNVDLVLMDIKLPGMNGYDTTKEIKKISHVPVIAQTAYAMADDMTKSLDAGCDAYVSKPINRVKLLGIISELMESYAN